MGFNEISYRRIIFNKIYDKEILVEADRNRIEQVMTNLITNSINYGSEKGTTEISFESKEEKIIVKVNDNGEGITEENMPRLFQRFFRVDVSRSRSQGGSGLGLAIVKQIIYDQNQIAEINIKENVDKWDIRGIKF